MIIQGDLHAGEWLRQERLARELGVSHTPIREALKQLEVEGLVEHVPYRGVRVIEFSMNDVEDMYTMRSALEGLATAAAAKHLTDAELAEIRRIHEAMVAIAMPKTPESLHALRELNRQFHKLIIQGSHRKYLMRTLEQIWSWFPTMLWSQFALQSDASAPERVDADNHDHEMIVRALEAHDPDSAEHLMRMHIDQTRQALIRHLNASQKVC